MKITTNQIKTNATATATATPFPFHSHINKPSMTTQFPCPTVSSSSSSFNFLSKKPSSIHPLPRFLPGFYKIPQSQQAMKKSGLFAASVAAVSATAASVSSPTCNSTIQLSREEASASKDQQGSASMDKFAPRFDGLRFIETLVTAHR